MDSYVYNGLYNKNYTRFNKEEDIAAAGLNYTTKLSTAKGVIAKVDGNVTGNKSIDVVNNGELTITGVIDTASFTNNGTLISDGGVLVEDRDGCKFINSGKIVASGRNIINTSDLGKIGGMDITADHNNARLDNAVIRLDGVKTANLKDQEIILHDDGYALTNTSGNLEILLEDTKINNDVITGRMLNSLKMASSEAVYGDLKGNNGVIAVTGDTTVAQADLVEQPTDPVAEPTNPDDIADQADQDADAQSGKDKKLNRVALAKKSEVIPAAALGAVAMINDNIDFIASSAVNPGFSYGDGLGRIVAVHGSKLEHEVGSSIDVSNYGASIGVSKDFGGVVLTPFVDIGAGKSKANGMGDTDTQAKHKHASIGILARIGVGEGAYGDASFRVGRNKTNFDGRVENEAFEFDSTATYYAGHIGLGYMAPLSETARMDLYAKYYLSHLAAQDFGLINKTTGEVQQWHIDSIISHVSKVGVAFNFNTSDALRWKVGAAWQRVYGSKAKSS